MRFIPPTKEYTLRDLADFVIKNRPEMISMTLEEEFWYRGLLNAEAMIPEHLTFHGLPIFVID
jgi:hypothetical protein